MSQQHTLRELIDAWLQEQIYSKPEDERTKRDELIIETSSTLCELLKRHEARTQTPARHADDSMVSVLRSYNEINRAYDLGDADLTLAGIVRQGRGRGTK